MKFKVTLLISALILTFVEDTFAQQYFFNHYQTTDGLPSNTIYATVQDKYGFIWIGTRDGICRFDGHYFVRIGDDLPSGILSGMTPALCIDGEGLLWFANSNGVGSYNIDTGVTTSISRMGIRDVSYIRADNNGNIWIVTSSIFKYNKGSREMTEYRPSEYFDPQMVAVDSFGAVWFTSTRGDLYRYDNRTDQFDIQPFNSLRNIVTTPEGYLLVSTLGNDVMLIDPQKVTERTIFRNGVDGEGRQILCLLSRQPGEYWIGTEAGIYIYTDKDGITAHIQESLEDPHAISASYVMNLYADREGNVWAGTFYTGLNLWQNKKDSYMHLYDNSSPNSIRGNIVRSIVSDNESEIWIGTEDGWLCSLNPQTWEVTNHGSDNDFINIQDVMIVGDELWIATYGNGLFRYRPDLKKAVRHYHFPNDFIIRQRQTMDGTILVGTHEGLYRYDGSSDSFERIEMAGDCFIHTIFQDSRGYIWVGTYGDGIILMDKDLKELRRLVPQDGSGLTSDHITSFFEDSKGRIWVTTEGGGVCWSEDRTPEEGPVFNNLNKTDGLPSNVTCAITEDLDGMLWISTTHGLTRMNPDGFAFTSSFFEESQITGGQYSYGAGYTAPNGMIYLGSTDGLVAFSPALLKSMDTKYDLYISGITAKTSDKTTELFTPGHSYYTSDKIKVRYRDISSLEITFAAPYYSSILATQYEYSLSHGRHTLSATTTDNKAVYTAIAPGHYTFEVGKVGDNRPEAHKKLRITITPPFYRSIVAKIAYCLAGLAVILGAIFLINKKKKDDREQHLEKIENEKRKEIYDAKIQYFTNITHEIRTPLSLIKMPVDKIIATNGVKETSREDMLTIQNNTERLLELTNQLLDIRKMEQKEMKLTFCMEDISSIVQKSCEYFTGITNERHIAFNLHIPQSPVYVECSGDSIEKIVTNLVSNAVKYGNDRIDVCLEDNGGDSVTIRVDSNGTPIETKDREKIFEPFYQVRMSNTPMEGSKGTGLGLPFAKTLAELHNGVLYIDNTIEEYNSFVLVIPKKHIDANSGVSLPEDKEKLGETTPEMDGSRHTILIVEDSADMRQYLMKELSTDYNTVSAGNGEEALNIIQEQKVDLVISDIMMPVMDGCELCNRIKTEVNYCHIPVLLLTAAVGVETRITTLKVGADGYIEKPFSMELMKASIDNLFKNKEISFKQFTESPLSHYNGVTVSSMDNDFMDRLHAEVMSHISEQDLNIEVLTSILGTSKSTLYRKIKANTGLNINEYIRLCRLKEAAEMLASQKYRINEVAYLVGFSSPSYFTTSFQKQFNISPSAFVKRIKDE